jgi:hypothetical protein
MPLFPLLSLSHAIFLSLSAAAFLFCAVAMNDDSDVEFGADTNLEPSDLTNPSHPTPLRSIWDCPKIVRSEGVGAAGRVWTCAWCPNDNNGQCPKPFIQWNSSKALYHELKMK